MKKGLQSGNLTGLGCLRALDWRFKAHIRLPSASDSWLSSYVGKSLKHEKAAYPCHEKATDTLQVHLRKSRYKGCYTVKHSKKHSETQ